MIDRRSFLGLLATAPLAGAAIAQQPTAIGWEAWRSILLSYVDEAGRVDFHGLAKDHSVLDCVVDEIRHRAPNNRPDIFLTAPDALAFHINAYNALSMAHVLRFNIPKKLSLLDRIQFFKLSYVRVGGERISLYDYENDIIRPFNEEKVHFALNCMSVSCPRLAQYPYSGYTLPIQLDLAAREFLRNKNNMYVDFDKKEIYISKIFDFYESDFLLKEKSIIKYIQNYSNVEIPEWFDITYLNYDWTVNIVDRS